VCGCARGWWVRAWVGGPAVRPRYEGPFVKGKFAGQGLAYYGSWSTPAYFCPAGFRHRSNQVCVYQGGWEDGLFHGKGTLRCCDGRYYVGQVRLRCSAVLSLRCSAVQSFRCSAVQSLQCSVVQSRPPLHDPLQERTMGRLSRVCVCRGRGRAVRLGAAVFPCACALHCGSRSRVVPCVRVCVCVGKLYIWACVRAIGPAVAAGQAARHRHANLCARRGAVRAHPPFLCAHPASGQRPAPEVSAVGLGFCVCVCVCVCA
jgi:hypothetical protein